MENFTLVKVDKIKCINVFNKRRNNDYFYKEYRKKSLFKKEIKQGFYRWEYDGDEEYIPNDYIEFDCDLYIEGKSVYYKPHITIYLHGDSFTKFFETKEELNEFLKIDKLSGINFIEV